MKPFNPYFYLISFAWFIMTSCTKEEFGENQITDHQSIQSEVSDGKTISRYRYNSIGDIIESEGLLFYNRYSYDNDGRLSKRESAMDPGMLSSTMHVERTELLTSGNCTINHFQLFKYGQNGTLSEIENYFNKDGDFALSSMSTFEYAGERITRKNLHNKEGLITQFHTYEHDNNGNVKKEMYYSHLFPESAEAKIISETSYKYDNKKNPFQLFKALGSPGIYSNTNNVIETNSILHEDTPGIEKYSTTNTSYIYNKHNYPIKVISENSEYEYRY